MYRVYNTKVLLDLSFVERFGVSFIGGSTVSILTPVCKQYSFMFTFGFVYIANFTSPFTYFAKFTNVISKHSFWYTTECVSSSSLKTYQRDILQWVSSKT